MNQKISHKITIIAVLSIMLGFQQSESMLWKKSRQALPILRRGLTFSQRRKPFAAYIRTFSNNGPHTQFLPQHGGNSFDRLSNEIAQIEVAAEETTLSQIKLLVQTESGFELTKHAKKQLIERFEETLSLSRLNELMHFKDAIRIIDMHNDTINVYVKSEFSAKSLIRITVPLDGNRIISIGFDSLKRIERLKNKKRFFPME